MYNKAIGTVIILTNAPIWAPYWFLRTHIHKHTHICTHHTHTHTTYDYIFLTEQNNKRGSNGALQRACFLLDKILQDCYQERLHMRHKDTEIFLLHEFPNWFHIVEFYLWTHVLKFKQWLTNIWKAKVKVDLQTVQICHMLAVTVRCLQTILMYASAG